MRYLLAMSIVLLGAGCSRKVQLRTVASKGKGQEYRSLMHQIDSRIESDPLVKGKKELIVEYEWTYTYLVPSHQAGAFRKKIEDIMLEYTREHPGIFEVVEVTTP